MANSGYTYTIYLKDLMTAGFAKAGQSASGFYSKLNEHSRKTQENMRVVPNSIAQLQQKLDQLRTNRDNAFDTKGIRRFNGEIPQTERQMNKLKNLPPASFRERLMGAGSTMGSLIGIAGGVGIAMAGFGAIGGVVKLGSDLEQTRISFQTMRCLSISQRYPVHTGKANRNITASSSE
jgi:hypothetical protein